MKKNSYEEDFKFFDELLSKQTFSPSSLSSFLFSRFQDQATINPKIRTCSKLQKWGSICSSILKDKWKKYDILALRKKIRKYKNNYDIDHNVVTKQAKPYSWDVQRAIAKHLWLVKPVRKYKNRNRLRKLTSLVPYLCCIAGARWGDLIKARWERIKWYKQHPDTNRRQASIQLPYSKNNPDGSKYNILVVPEVLRTQENSTFDCPYKALLRLYAYLGFPSSGPLLPNEFSQSLTERQTFHQFVSAASKCFPDFNPSMHSGRVLCAGTLHLMGLSPEAINKYFHWRSPEMETYYLRDLISRNKNAPARRMAQELESGNLSRFQFFAPDKDDSYMLK